MLRLETRALERGARAKGGSCILDPILVTCMDKILSRETPYVIRLFVFVIWLGEPGANDAPFVTLLKRVSSQGVGEPTLRMRLPM